MTKVVHPYSHRIGILRDWKSKWFFSGAKYKDNLVSDLKLRKFLDKRLKGLFVSLVEIERSEKALRIILKTSRPGVIIGRSGEGAQKLKADIEKFIRKNNLEASAEVKVDIVEVDNPDADARIVAYSVAEGLEKRMPFRRVGKQVVEKVMATRGVEGVRILLSGRLGGADMARTEEIKKGSIPLQTFRADIDFARERASLPYGDIGIKVWIYKGEVFEDNNN
ncbi:30S ribosomal protein S3 [Candidatus Nomurabacteria bacterium]|nr:30S ribosomal protein S3 [Candidatus Nomurabacteria bacterium]MCB9820757.1 30S ribosomal protein S3 [Candidatus Nomurabacteria bacterium]